MRTGLNKSEVMMVLQELNEAILYFAGDGTPVKLPGVGTFTPSIDRRGNLKLNYRADMVLKNGLNTSGAFTGQVRNKNRIGLDDPSVRSPSAGSRLYVAPFMANRGSFARCRRPRR